jgi:hypothetical protein
VPDGQADDCSSLRIRVASALGVEPNSRRYSRLNWEADV